jgi:hypothetical protein
MRTLQAAVAEFEELTHDAVRDGDLGPELAQALYDRLGVAVNVVAALAAQLRERPP